MGAKGLKHPLKRAEPKSGFGVFLERHGRTILGLLCWRWWCTTCSAAWLYRDAADAGEIDRVRKDLDRLNKENLELGDQVRALKTDPRLIEKIAREDLQRAKPGEIIIRICRRPVPASGGDRRAW